MSKKSVLIIGGAGYIGSHVTLEFCEAGYKVFVFDDLSTGHLKNIDDRAEFIEGSILNIDQLQLAFEKTEPDTVIHLAALKDAGESMLQPDKYSRHNINGTVNILEMMVKFGVRNMIFSSSAAVYGMPEYLPLDENHPLKPINYYGYTKLVVENMLAWYSGLKNIRYAALRYFNAVGYDPLGRITGIERNPANLLPIIMETINGERKAIEIFGDDYNTDDGTCERDYIHVSDLATAHLRSAEYLMINKENLITNLATGKRHSVLDVIKICEKVIDNKIPYKIGGRRIGDAPIVYSKSINSENLFNWSPQYTSFPEVIKSMVEVYSNKFISV